MTLSRRIVAPAVALAVCVAATALAPAPSALADSTLSQSLAPGASLSTGSTVSAADPVQLTVTAPSGGDFTIDEVSAPPPPSFKGSGSLAWSGPQFTVSATNAEPATITMLADPSVLPSAPTEGTTPQWRSPAAQQKLCASQVFSFCITTQAAMINFCDWTPSPAFGDCTAWGKQLGSTELLPDGDVQATMQLSIVSGGETFGAAYPAWSCGPGTIVVNAPTFGTGTLGDLIAHGIYYSDDCTWYSSVTATVSVSEALARRLHLQSPVIGRISNGPGMGPIDLAATAKTALRRLHKAIDVTVALDARGSRSGQSWSDTVTVHVPS